MELCKLLGLIDEEIKTCESNYAMDQDLVDIKKVLDGNTSITTSNITTLDPDLLFIICANFLSETSSYDTVRMFYNYDPNYFKNGNYDRIGRLFQLTSCVIELVEKNKKSKSPRKMGEFDYVKAIIDDEVIEEFADDPEAQNFLRAIDLLKDITEEEYNLVSTFIKNEGVNTDTLIKMLMIALLPINNKLKVKSERDYTDLLEKANVSRGLLSKSKNKKNVDVLYQSCINAFCRENRLDGFLRALNAYIGVLEREDNNRKKTIKEKTNKYRMLSKRLEYATSSEITNIDELMSLCDSEDIKKSLAVFVYQHNSQYNATLELEYDNSIKDNQSLYLLLLDDFGITVSKEQLNILISKDYDEVKRTFSKFRDVGFSKDKYIEMLNIYDEELFNRLLPLLEEKIISSEFVCKYFEDLDDTKLNLLFNNVSAFKSYNIPQAIILANDDILLEDRETIVNNFGVLKRYQLLSLIGEGSNLDFLNSKCLETTIDIILESGFEKILESDINILNRPITDWQRVRLLLSLGIEVSNSEKLNKVLDTSSLVIPDAEITNYFDEENSVINNSLVNNEVKLPEILDKFNYTKRTYLIGNRIISKEKVKRNYPRAIFLDKIEPGRALLTSIITGGSFTEEDHYNISLQLKKAK